MSFEEVFAVILVAAMVVVVLTVFTTAARHRRMDTRHAQLRELRRQTEFGDARGVSIPHWPVEREGRFVRERAVTAQKIRWSAVEAGD